MSHQAARGVAPSTQNADLIFICFRFRSVRLLSMECAQFSRAVTSCLVKRLLPTILLLFPLLSSAFRRLRSLEVRWAGPGRVEGKCGHNRRIRTKTPLCLPGAREATTTLHMLTLLKDMLPCFPEALVKSCSETLLRVMTLNHVVSSGHWKNRANVGNSLSKQKQTNKTTKPVPGFSCVRL